MRTVNDSDIVERELEIEQMIKEAEAFLDSLPDIHSPARDQLARYAPLWKRVSKLPRSWRIVATLLFSLVLVVQTALIAPLILVPGPIIFFGVALWIEQVAERDGVIRLRTTWPVLVTTMLLAALFIGLTTTPGSREIVRFRNSEVADGTYYEVARSDSFVYFVPCEPEPDAVLAVHEADIASITIPAQKNISIGDAVGLIVGGPTPRISVGPQYTC